MAIQTQVWIRELAEKLYPNNSFVMESIDDSAWVNNKTVNLPQAGATPEVQKNRSVFPAPLVKRTDTLESYDLDEYTSTPSLIQDIEEVEVSYNKRQSVLDSHAKELNLVTANNFLNAIAGSGASNIIRTTGADVESNTASATGNRKALTIDDLNKARQMFDDMDVPEEGRCILLPAHMYNNMINLEKDVILSKDFNGDVDIKQGVVTRILGFKIYKRGKKNVVRYTNAATPVIKDFTAAGAATDNAAAILWHKDFVRRAKGSTKVFYDVDKPEYYGSVFSALTRFAAKKWYADQTGCLSIVEAASA